MLKALREFFEGHLAMRPGQSGADAAQRLRVAAAVLLVEVARSDHEFSPVERESVQGLVQRRFGLGAAEAGELLDLAEAESRESHDLYQFTSAINAGFPHDDKVRLVEELWRAAHSDQFLHGHEEHLIRRIADLLHVTHSQYISAKLRAVSGT